jgi:hypothetical protein
LERHDRDHERRVAQHVKADRDAEVSRIDIARRHPGDDPLVELLPPDHQKSGHTDEDRGDHVGRERHGRELVQLKLGERSEDDGRYGHGEREVRQSFFD